MVNAELECYMRQYPEWSELAEQYRNSPTAEWVLAVAEIAAIQQQRQSNALAMPNVDDIADDPDADLEVDALRDDELRALSTQV